MNMIFIQKVKYKISSKFPTYFCIYLEVVVKKSSPNAIVTEFHIATLSMIRDSICRILWEINRYKQTLNLATGLRNTMMEFKFIFVSEWDKKSVRMQNYFPS